jgi:NAD(P)H-hydrate epimerase
MMRLLVAFGKDVNFSEDRISKVEKATKLLGGTIVLKGNKTIVSYSDKALSINNTGSQALATAGTGDVLSGIIGAFASSSLDGFDASRISVYIHGFAGELVQKKNGIRGTIADDIIEAIPEALRIISPFA